MKKYKREMYFALYYTEAKHTHTHADECNDTNPQRNTPQAKKRTNKRQTNTFKQANIYNAQKQTKEMHKNHSSTHNQNNKHTHTNKQITTNEEKREKNKPKGRKIILQDKIFPQRTQ